MIFGKGDYDLANRNCEHLANSLAYRINFSQQVYEKRDDVRFASHISDSLALFTPGALFSPLKTIKKVARSTNPVASLIVNNGKDSVCLEGEIRSTDSLLSKKSDWETEKYENKYLQEVPPKENCRIM